MHPTRRLQRFWVECSVDQAAMPKPQKFKDVMSVIERRIRQGDYLLAPIPGERKIAEETGVSHMTARKAVRGLLDRKILIRQPNGLLEVFPGFQNEIGASHVLLLSPAYASVYLLQLSQLITEAAAEYGLNIRPVQYVHWDDPVINSAVNNPAGLILIPSSENVPNYLLESLRSSKSLSIDLDLSEQGIPSIRPFPDRHIVKVFDELRAMGHRHIDCISSQFHNPEIDRRIRLWQEWLTRHGLSGELIESPTRPFGDAMTTACETMRSRLAQRPLEATAIIGTTFPAAMGAMRACWERDLRAGRDVSICSVNIESPAKCLTPSMSGLDMPKMSDLLHKCFEWFSSKGSWTGNKRLEPRRAIYHRGESVGEPLATVSR